MFDARGKRARSHASQVDGAPTQRTDGNRSVKTAACSRSARAKTAELSRGRRRQIFWEPYAELASSIKIRTRRRAGVGIHEFTVGEKFQNGKRNAFFRNSLGGRGASAGAPEVPRPQAERRKWDQISNAFTVGKFASELQEKCDRKWEANAGADQVVRRIPGTFTVTEQARRVRMRESGVNSSVHGGHAEQEVWSQPCLRPAFPLPVRANGGFQEAAAQLALR